MPALPKCSTLGNGKDMIKTRHGSSSYLEVTYHVSSDFHVIKKAPLALSQSPATSYNMFPLISALAVLLGSQRALAASDPIPPTASSCPNNSHLSPLTHKRSCPRLVDDETAILTNSWYPWSIPPTCFDPTKQKGKRPRVKLSKLCTFTTLNTWAGTPLSIITTPETAADVASFIHSPYLSWLENDRGGVPFRPTHYPKNPFKVEKLPNRGYGVLATEPIKKGTVLMAQLPVMLQLLESAEQNDKWETRDVLRLLQRAGNQLPKEQQREVMGLAAQGKGYIVDDIMKTNTFDVTVGVLEGSTGQMGWGSHSGLYPEIAVGFLFFGLSKRWMTNLTSCFTRFSPSTLIMEIVAYKDISPGEELSISYAPLNILSADRSELLKWWGFTCTCALCQNPTAIKKSDKQRNRIQALLEEFDTPSRLTEEKIAEIEQLVREEGMEGQMGDLYNIIGNVYAQRGEIERAKEYGKKGVVWLKQYAGADSERTEMAKGFVKRLEDFERGRRDWRP
ncbi:uncharacterized protein PODANS_1_21930 [Podospora anserina S mat+]|uniref:Podospora anserina S mat+ genomic DNA chromosome 1, supercontig 6 n=1 Tax=Podospora anserina (strain S / ATCC MYA-4624 / DSM 980 / FGSC 10383) TaxID=515849 RepID=B2AS08_PODAN|nr:uncharacterized protein PODANS_1_21930 [Podospora anserina S mat+]CAP67179.1 unnamed protein product [Podospora anserina S mat+]CDP24592.1 Putative protein of unknown function [Podospora anserina S mat+]